MKRRTKKLLSLLLSLALVAGMIPMYGITANALEPLPDFNVSSDGVVSWTHVPGADRYYVLHAASNGGMIVLSLATSQYKDNDTLTWTSEGVTFDLQKELEEDGKVVEKTHNITIKACKGEYDELGYESSFDYSYVSKIPQLTDPKKLRWNGSRPMWDPVPGADKYEIYIYRTSSSSNVWNTTLRDVVADPIGSSGYISGAGWSVNPDETYYFTVQAYGVLGKYRASKKVTGPTMRGNEILSGKKSAVGTHTVITNTLNVREAAGTEFNRIGGIVKGQEVSVLETQGEWSKIIYGNGYGWVMNQYLAPIVSKGNPFVDVSEDDDYYGAVLWAYFMDPQITNGIDDSHFGPMKTVTRGQCAAFLWRAMGCPEPSSSYNPFVDVPTWQYYYKPILWAVEKGITKGTDATHFSPDQTLSTAHIITFLYRTKNPGVDGWYSEAAYWAQFGYGTNKPFGIYTPVNPDTDCPRAYVVQFLQKSK